MEIEKLRDLIFCSLKKENILLVIKETQSDANLSLDSKFIALVVNDILGGKIIGYMIKGVNRYVNLIDSKFLDFTEEHVLLDIYEYDNIAEISRESLLSDKYTKKAYEKLLYNLKQLLKQQQGKKFKLVNSDDKQYFSDIPGRFGGNKKLKIYGKLDCPSAKRWIEKGYYISNRVFFENEDTAITAGYKPCAVCMPDKYKEWKNNQKIKL